MHQRLMFAMIVYGGIIALIALRILWLAAFGDHAGRKESVTALVPERGDIVDRALLDEFPDDEGLARLEAAVDARVPVATVITPDSGKGVR